jgi:bifunctional ADP-heptose synthase (sugar kinase/adenylyltransferase)
MADIPQSLLDRILAPSEIARRDWQGGRPLVFTNGVFDLLHAGHVVYLTAARALGARYWSG